MHNKTKMLSRFVAAVDSFTLTTGHAVAWLLLLMVFIQCLVVMLRYGFNVGSIALQESVTYLHACCFMLGAAYTLKMDRHVRVDILYHRLNPRQQAMINFTGAAVFLLPVCLLIFFTSLDYAQQAWIIKERSSDTGGLAIVYLLKTLIPLAAASLILQGLAEMGRAALCLFPPHNNKYKSEPSRD